MLRKFLHHARGNLVAYIALFFALGGTSAYASHLIVRSSDIVDNEVRTADVRNDGLSGGGLTSPDVRPNALSGSDINESSLGKVPNSDKLDGLDSSAFRVRCPGGTRFHEGACIETAGRAEATWVTAQATCVAANRRLPSVAELMNFRLRSGITLGGDGEWTDHVFLDDGTSLAEDVAEDGSRTFSDSTSGETLFRCVATPSG